MAKLRKATGVRELMPGLFEIYVSLGRDPLTGRYRQKSERFHGSFKEAKLARAELLLKVNAGHFSARRIMVDELCVEWLKHLRQIGRSVTTIDEYERRYNHDIKIAIGHLDVTAVTTKVLTDLYAAHSNAGASPGSVVKIHATISSMMSQACRWGIRADNPAAWAQPPAIPLLDVVVPEPEDVLRLIDGARASRRPVYAKVIFLSATTGLRRGELCALRRSDVSLEHQSLTVKRSIRARRKQLEPGETRKTVGPTKNRRARTIAVDSKSLAILEAQIKANVDRAQCVGELLVADPYIFSDSLDGSEPWHPDAITRYFSRLRNGLELDHVTVKSLRAFMDTYGQDLGFTTEQVALRAGHDPAVAGRHYTARVSETDRQIAEALSNLLE